MLGVGPCPEPLEKRLDEPGVGPHRLIVVEGLEDLRVVHGGYPGLVGGQIPQVVGRGIRAEADGAGRLIERRRARIAEHELMGHDLGIGPVDGEVLQLDRLDVHDRGGSPHPEVIGVPRDEVPVRGRAERPHRGGDHPLQPRQKRHVVHHHPRAPDRVTDSDGVGRRGEVDPLNQSGIDLIGSDGTRAAVRTDGHVPGWARDRRQWRSDRRPRVVHVRLEPGWTVSPGVVRIRVVHVRQQAADGETVPVDRIFCIDLPFRGYVSVCAATWLMPSPIETPICPSGSMSTAPRTYLAISSGIIRPSAP